MLSTRISLSKKVASISFPAEAIYTRILPHADDAGRFTADLDEFRAVVIPLGKNGKQIPCERIRAWLEELHKIGLIVLYSDNGNQYLEIVDFVKFNPPKSDRPKSINCPEPTESGQWNPAESSAVPLSNSNSNSNSNMLDLPAEYVREFDETLWPLVEKKVTRKDTLTLFCRLRKNGTPLEILVRGLTNYQNEKKAEGTEIKFFKDPKTFFGPGEHWRDYAERTIEKSCSTCLDGPKADKPAYCLVTSTTKAPGDKPCDKYREVEG